MKVLKSPLFGAALVWIIIQILVANLITPPPPGMIKLFYGAVSFVGVMVFIASDDRRLKEFWSPIEAVLLAECGKTKIIRAVLFLLIPALVGLKTYNGAVPNYLPPAEPRTVHPEPPGSYTVHGTTYQLKEVKNPLREGKDLAKVTEEGHKVYYQNCFFCHGDFQKGEGMYSYGLNPIPANFRDPTTIAMLQESYVFWRVGLGYSGLPGAGTPWNSAMPIWQEHLTDEEIWSAIVYIYESTGQSPRTWGAE